MDDFERRRKMNELKKEAGREHRERRQQAQMRNQKPGVLTRFFRFVGKLIVLCLVIMIAFFAGRLSLRPTIAQHLPDLPVTLPNAIQDVVAPAMTPEAYLEDFLQAVRQRNFDRIYPIADPKFPTRDEKYERIKLESLSRKLADLQEYKIQNIKQEVKIVVNFRNTKGETQEGAFRIERENDKWSMPRFYY
jgi:hypothetical protein